MNARKKSKQSSIASEEDKRKWPAAWGEPSKEERRLVPPPKWKIWIATRCVSLENAILLSLGYDPTFFRGESISHLLDNDPAKKNFDERLEMLRGHHKEATILLSDFASRAVTEFKWEGLPYQLKELATKPAGATASSADIPGKVPRTGMGKLAIKAAWQIECKTQHPANANDVMTRLQGWANTKSESDVLLESRKDKHGVDWQTVKGVTKLYDLGACAKALAKWKKSRPKQNLSRI